MKAEEIAEKEAHKELDKFEKHSDGDEFDCAIHNYKQGFINGYNYDKWIKCSEEMPKDRSSCLVFIDPFKIVSEYFGDAFYDENRLIIRPTHWQPLPNKPTEL